METQTAKFRLGLFVVGAAIMLAVLIVLFGEFPKALTGRVRYTLRFNEASGVEPGTPVVKSGVEIGEVEDLQLNPETGEVLIRIAVKKEYLPRRSDRAELGRGLILGDAVIRFVPDPKAEDRSPAPPDYVFTGKVSESLTQAMARASDLLPLAQETLEDIRTAAQGIGELIPEVRDTNAEAQVAVANFGRAAEGVDNLIRGNYDQLARAIENFVDASSRVATVLNEENQRNLADALRNVRAASERLESLAMKTESLITETQNTVRTVGTRVDQVGQNADQFINETRQVVKTVAERIDRVGKNADALIGETRQTMQTIGHRVDRVGSQAEALIGDTRETVQIVGDRVDRVSKSAEALMKEGRVTVQHLNQTLSRTDEVLGQIQTATKPLAERAPIMMKNLEESSIRINQITFQLAEFVKALNRGDGTLRRLLVDPTLYNNVNNLAAGFGQSVTRLDRILRDLELFADKVARHPELLGVSGAINPSSGIKR